MISRTLPSGENKIFFFFFHSKAIHQLHDILGHSVKPSHCQVRPKRFLSPSTGSCLVVIPASLSIFDEALDVLILSIGTTILNHESLDQIISSKSRHLLLLPPSLAVLLQVARLFSERKILDSVTTTGSPVSLRSSISFNEGSLVSSGAWVAMTDLQRERERREREKKIKKFLLRRCLFFSPVCH